MKLLNGSELAGFIKQRQAQDARGLIKSSGKTPVLAIVQDHPNPVIDTYVRLKIRYGQDIGVEVRRNLVDSSDLRSTIDQLNSDESVHGIIIQLPLVDQQTTDELVNRVAGNKDVDGLGKSAKFDPATPTAILWLLAGYGIELAGRQVALVGNGRLVGAPLKKMLDGMGVNSRVIDQSTPDFAASLQNADVIIAAAGKAGIIKSDMIKSGAVIVDAGTSSEQGEIQGDVSGELYERDDITITPQKGGVGPLTVAALFDNVLKAARAIVTSP